jgi:cold shock CspA family protein
LKSRAAVARLAILGGGGASFKTKLSSLALIEPAAAGNDVFAHASAIPDRLEELREGQKVSFDANPIG